MEKESPQELSYDALKVRQISNQYLDVLSNAEPLSQLVRFNVKTKKVLLASRKIATDMKSFFYLIVQLTYLLYTCLLKKVNLFVGGEMLSKLPSKIDSMPMQEVYVQFLLDRQFNRMSRSEQQVISKKFRFIELTKSETVFGDFICEFIGKIKNMIKSALEKIKNTPESYLCRQMEGLTLILEKHLQPQVRTLSPQIFMLCLEQSQLFREYSLLLKVFNNSVFVAIRYFHNSRGIYNQLLKMQEQYIMNSRGKGSFMEYVEKVQLLMQESFKVLLMNHIVTTEHSLEELQDNKESSTKKYLVGSIKGASFQSRKYNAHIFIKEKPLKVFTEQSLQEITKAVQKMQYECIQEVGMQKGMKMSVQGLKQKQKKDRSECLVEFHSSKNMLCIKYITNIELNLQNTDLLMFHCNFMSYTWNSITLQFYEKNFNKNKKKQKFLAFKTVSYLTPQERIIFKILTMIDMLIVYAKIVEPQLKKSIYNVEQYDLKNSDLNEKCQHLKALFVKKVQECYLMLQNNRK